MIFFISGSVHEVFQAINEQYIYKQHYFRDSNLAYLTLSTLMDSSFWFNATS